jgi:hypothetical protein
MRCDGVHAYPRHACIRATSYTAPPLLCALTPVVQVCLSLLAIVIHLKTLQAQLYLHSWPDQDAYHHVRDSV